MNKIINKFFERLQKVTVLVLCVMLAGSLYSCAEKAETGGEVSYKPCPCEEGKEEALLYKGEAYLVKDTLSIELLYTWLEEKNPTLLNGIILFCIIFDSKTNSTCLYSTGYMYVNMGRICNFPDFAKEWDIPKNGCKVYFEGIRSRSCEYVPQQCCGWNDFYFGFDFTLTNLKRE
ncbi:MAG: hypothetical protein FWH23_08355 [Bacteroidales bacterium]|nr:hypothetical protein [Bacteroidales bacterium]